METANKIIKVFDLKEDKKIKAKCLLIDISIGKYIELVESNLEDMDIMDIQRGKILSRKRDVYKRLMEDLKEETIIPPISLVLREKSKVQNEIKSITEIQDIEKRINEGIEKGDLSILDGLQRTYCILNVIDDLKNKETFLDTRIRAELWYDITYTAILYKMLVLNTGQVKMSMRHQIEILNILLREKISEVASEDDVSVEFSTYKNPLPIDNTYAYKFSDIVEAFTSFIIKDPIVDKTNVVVQELERMKFIEEHSTSAILGQEEEIREFTKILIALDKALGAKYNQPIKSEDETGKEIKFPWTSRNEIMGSAAVLSGIFASFGKAFNDKDKYNKCKKEFFEILQKDENDPLKLKIMSTILQDEKKRSTKFGETTRNFFFKAFKEFFNGENNFEIIWQRATA